MSIQLGFNVEVPLSFDAAVTRVREALKQEGFGVLTEIDLRAAFLGAQLHAQFPRRCCRCSLKWPPRLRRPSIRC